MVNGIAASPLCPRDDYDDDDDASAGALQLQGHFLLYSNFSLGFFLNCSCLHNKHSTMLSREWTEEWTLKNSVKNCTHF